MRITASERKALEQRRQIVVTPAPGELVAVMVHGKLVNPKNASIGWQNKAWRRYKREWRERVAQALLVVGYRPDLVSPRAPKHVHFQARTFNAMDGDGLQLALAAVRDELITCGVVSGDADRDGHVFLYSPCIVDRAHLGVEIHVRLRGLVEAMARLSAARDAAREELAR